MNGSTSLKLIRLNPIAQGLALRQESVGVTVRFPRVSSRRFGTIMLSKEQRLADLKTISQEASQASDVDALRAAVVALAENLISDLADDLDANR
jgi:hypothetical protein